MKSLSAALIFSIAVVGSPVATAAPAAPPAPTPAPPSPYGQLHPEVFRVESGGAWERSGRAGHYRTVVLKRCSHEHCYDTLFIEWLAIEGGEATLVTQKQVDEVGDQTLVSRVSFILTKSGTRLEVTHQSESSRQRWTRCLHLGAPGTYTATEGRCRKSA